MMRSPRRGISLLEVLLALSIAAVPLIIAVSLLQRNARHARRTGEGVMARMLLMDILEVLLGEDVEALREEASDPKMLQQVVNKRVSALPGFAQASYRESIDPFLSTLRLVFEEAPDPRLPGLSRLILILELEGERNARLELRQLFRPAARDLAVSLK